MDPTSASTPRSTPLHEVTSPGGIPSASSTPDAAALPRLALAVFLAYMTVALPLPVIPLYVHDGLGFGNVVAGLSIGIQFVATILTRGYAGRLADHSGARRSMRSGLVFCALSGAVYMLSALLPLEALPRLLLLMAGRLVLGFGESQLVIGALAWGIGLVGQPRTGRVLSWMGMAMYGALAAGAPAGLWLSGLDGTTGGGMAIVGLATLLLPLLALVTTTGITATRPAGGTRGSFWGIVGRIRLPGLAVALQGIGFAAIGAFATLHFTDRGWPHAGLALRCFGGAFVLVRILLGHAPDRFGGIPVALASLAVETAGLLLLWSAGTPLLALAGAAVTGAGCSLVFPALGVEVVKHVPPQIRGTALGGFAAFQDLSYAVTGPLAGLVANALGYAAIFGVSALAALLGLGMVLAMRLRAEAGPA